MHRKKYQRVIMCAGWIAIVGSAGAQAAYYINSEYSNNARPGAGEIRTSRDGPEKTIVDAIGETVDGDAAANPPAIALSNRTSAPGDLASVLGGCCVETICPCQPNYYDSESPALICGQVTVGHTAEVFECFDGGPCDTWPEPGEVIILDQSANLATCDGGGPLEDEADPLYTLANAACSCAEGQTAAITMVSSPVVTCSTTADADSLHANIVADFELTTDVVEGCLNLCGNATASVSTPVVTNPNMVGCSPLGPPTTAIPFEVDCPVYADVTATLKTSWLDGDDGRGIGIWVIRTPGGVVASDVFDFEDPGKDTRGTEVLLSPGEPYTFLATYSVLDATAHAGTAVGTDHDEYVRDDFFDVDVVFREPCVQAVDYSINRGTFAGDDCAARQGACILCSDDLRVHVNSVPGFTASKLNVVEFDADLVAAADCIDDADTLDVAVELHAPYPNNVQLHLRNWNTGVFNPIGGVTMIPGGNTDTVVCVSNVANAPVYIGNNGEIEVRVETWAGLIPTVFYTNRFDLVQVEIRPIDP